MITAIIILTSLLCISHTTYAMHKQLLIQSNQTNQSERDSLIQYCEKQITVTNNTESSTVKVWHAIRGIDDSSPTSCDDFVTYYKKYIIQPQKTCTITIPVVTNGDFLRTKKIYVGLNTSSSFIHISASKSLLNSEICMRDKDSFVCYGDTIAIEPYQTNQLVLKNMTTDSIISPPFDTGYVKLCCGALCKIETLKSLYKNGHLSAKDQKRFACYITEEENNNDTKK